MHFVQAKGILSAHNGMNIFRGCQHGCIYCDSRSKCYHINHEFEDIEVKQNAPELLERALRSKRNRCMIGTGSMTDPYIPLERELGYTRRCLELIEQYGFGATIITKSADVLRDLDLLERINDKAKCVVQMTLTTFDESLCRILEPQVSTTRERFKALCTLREHGIPTVVWIDPIIPFLTDTAENLRGILDYCVAAGVKGILCFCMGMTLREGNREYFYQKLDEHLPGLREKIHNQYGYSYELTSVHSARLMKILREECDAHGIMHGTRQVLQYLSALPDPMLQAQLSLF